MTDVAVKAFELTSINRSDIVAAEFRRIAECIRLAAIARNV